MLFMSVYQNKLLGYSMLITLYITLQLASLGHNKFAENNR